MDVDDIESGPASPEPENFEQAWSPTNSADGVNSEDDRLSSPGTPPGEPMEPEEGSGSGGNVSPMGSNEGSDAGAPRVPIEDPTNKDGEEFEEKPTLSSQPASPIQTDAVSPASPSGPEEAEDNDFDTLDLEEGEEEKEQRIKVEQQSPAAKLKTEPEEGESPDGAEEQQHDSLAEPQNINDIEPKKEPFSDGNESGNDEKEDVLNTSKSSLHDDHGELDYDEDIHEETNEPEERKDDEKSEEDGDIRKVERRDENKKAADSVVHGSDEDDGELEDDDDCEEGEIKEPGSNKKPFIRPICRFYNRGNCTWGSSCRFLHPGVNDKGNYSLIERTERPAPSGIFSRLGPPINGGQWGGADGPTREDAPHPPSPPMESSWERGLRQAKELMKRANKRRETETNFEEKRLNLSLEEDKDHNKENDRGRFAKDPYYDNSYDDEDEYYGKSLYNSPQPSNHWHGGHYENFEVRWTRESEYQSHRRSPHMPERERLRERMPRERRYSPETERIRATVHQPSAVFLPRRMTPETERLRYEKRHNEKNERYDKYDNFDRMPNYNRPLPYMHEERPERMERSDRKRPGRGDRGDHSDRFERPERPERIDRPDRSERPDRPDRPERQDRPDRPERMERGDDGPQQRKRGDEWHDPWIRAKKSPVRKRSTSRSRSRGRRRSFSRGSRGSSSSSYTSSSGSSRGSRSRSSSYSSYTSRSSSSSSSGSSRSRSRGPKRRPMQVPGPTNSKEQRPPMPTKPGETPKSTVMIKPGARGGPPPRSGPPGPNEPRPPGGSRGPNQGASGGPPPSRGGPPPRGPPAPRPTPPLPPPPQNKPGPNRSPEKKPAAPSKAGPPERGRPRERGPPTLPKRKYSGSSTGSSRSRSYSSSSSRSGSASSRSSVSSSSSSSSSGSADSEHLYRDIASGHSSDSSRSPQRRKGIKPVAPGKKRSKTKDGPPQPPPPAPQNRPPNRPAEGPRRPAGLGEKNGVRPSPDKRNFRGPRPDSKPMPEERPMPDRRHVADGMGGRQVRERDQFVTEKDAFGRDVARGGRDVHVREREPAGRENMTREKRHEDMPPRPKKPDDVGGRRPNRGGPEDMLQRVVRHDDDRPRSGQPQAVMKSVKQDPLKLSGQKSNIKLTLINKSADKSSQAKKRAANDAAGGAPTPAKRPAPAKPPQPKEPKAAPKPVSASSVRPDKPKPPPPKQKAEDKAPVAQKRPEPPTAPKAPAPPAPKPKKSASSRREELLKQLKAVEDAIARKRAKLS